MKQFQSGDCLHLVDTKNRSYALTLKAGDVFQYSGQTISHDELIGKSDGSLVTLSGGKSMVALFPTFAEYILKMPRGAQVLYPKDLAMITVWGDVYPGSVVFEAGVGSGALTMALLRAVGERGQVVSFEVREDFAKTAKKNIDRFLGPVSNFTLRIQDVYQGFVEEGQDQQVCDRVILDLPEPWRVVEHVRSTLRLGGLFLSFVPTVPQVIQTVETIRQTEEFGFIETFETLFRSWNIRGRSVRPDHRMVAHSGFITVARKVEKGWREDRHSRMGSFC
jgi:tRNA (adenine57-N1/adenine58-N1)-methyltransferase